MIIARLQALCLITFVLSIPGDYAVAQRPTKVAPATALPPDPAVRTGTLANGFTYYIQRNTEPAKRVQLYLVVKAGSVLEDDDQQGLAHYLEHMAFNGTTHFPKNALIDYLQKSGVRFGSDLNAYTSFNETVYQLPLPTDDPAVLDNGFQIMRDWAHGALLDPAELEKERGVILEEKRMGKGLQDRLREKTLPVTMNHSRYAQRLPIGTEAVLTSFTRARMAVFYEDWYRPNLQAIIVVGDIAVDETEQRVRKLFGDLKNPRKPKKRIDYNIPLTGKNQYLVVTDAEQSNTVLQMTLKHEAGKMQTTADLRRAMVTSLLNSVVAERLGDLSKQDTPPFMRAAISIAPVYHNVDALSLYVMPKPGETEAAFRMLYTELVRYRDYGFSKAALQRASARYMAAREAEYNERDKTPSSELVERYITHFTAGTASPSVAYEHAFVKEQLGTITVADLDALWKEYFRESNRDIILTAPGQATLPDEATLNRWIEEVTTSRPAPVAEMEAGLLLMTSKPAAGKVTDRKELTALGITELTLSNGVKVILKPTSFKNDEILLQGFSPGGTSLYGNKDFMSATAAADLIAASGVGGLNAIQLPKVLSGKQAGAKPFINERFEGIGAAAGKADLETALQLVYLYMTAPRKDSTLYQVFMKRQVAALQNRGVNPANVFTDTINAVLGNNHYRRTAPSLDKLNTLSLDRLYAIYKERFADAGDFTFVMVGSFTVDAIVPLLEQYLGGLPSTHHQETATDLGIRMPQGKMVRKVYKGQEDKATVRLVFNGPHQYNQLNNLQLDALKEVLQLRLTERLREAEGGVYSPSVNLSYTKYPTATFTYTVAFDCAPANADKLVAATLQEIDKLKTQGPPAEDVQKNRTAKKRQWETMQNSNEFWYGFLANVYMENESPDKALTYLSTLDQITPLSLQQTAKNCFDGKNVIEFVLLPGAMQQQ